MHDKIDVGDKINIQFATHPPIVGLVTYTPQAPCDSWHIKTEDGDVIYVQQFDFMMKINQEV